MDDGDVNDGEVLHLGSPNWGEGSPIGVVTPVGPGVLYVDTDAPTLWQSTGDTDQDWEHVSPIVMPKEAAAFPPLFRAQSALANATGPANPGGMSPGNWSAHYDEDAGQIVFTALDADGNELTGSVAVSD